jgi:small subunit ribosomal protein S20
MPVTKTAKRALRGSKNKAEVNKLIIKKLEIAVRLAKKTKKEGDIIAAVSLTDRAAKKKVIHKNKASRIKSQLSRLFVGNPVAKSPKKTAKKVSTAKK